MKISRILELLDATILTSSEYNDASVDCAFSSDFLSDVLSNIDSRSNKVLFITGLINLQVIRTAEMIDINYIVFVGGKKPDEAIIKLAEDIGIVLISTDYPMFIASGILYKNGLPGLMIKGADSFGCKINGERSCTRI